jgi:hypothetical protein
MNIMAFFSVVLWALSARRQTPAQCCHVLPAYLFLLAAKRPAHPGLSFPGLLSALCFLMRSCFCLQCFAVLLGLCVRTWTAVETGSVCLEHTYSAPFVRLAQLGTNARMVSYGRHVPRAGSARRRLQLVRFVLQGRLARTQLTHLRSLPVPRELSVSQALQRVALVLRASLA